MVLAVLAGDHHRGLGDLAHGQDGGLRRVDDGHEVIQVEHPQGGHGEGAAVVVLVRQAALPGLLDELCGLLRDAGEADDVGVPDHGDDQPAGDGDGGADVDIIMVDDVIAIHAGVDDGEVLQGLGAGPDDDVVVGDLDAQGLVLVPQGHGGGHVHHHPVVGLGVGGLAGQHIPGDGLAHPAHGLGAGAPGQLAGDGLHRRRCGRGLCRGAGVGQVLRGDLAVGAGAGDAGEVNALEPGLVGGQRRHGGLMGEVGLHVPLHHQAVRPGAGDGGDIHAVFLRPQPGPGRGEHPFAGGPLHGRRRGGGRRGRRGSRSFLRRLGRGRRGIAQQAGDVLAGLAHDGDGLGDGDRVPLGVQDLQHRAGGGGVHGDGQLVSLHLKEGGALGGLLALLHQPLGDGALLHQEALLGHDDDRSHVVSSFLSGTGTPCRRPRCPSRWAVLPAPAPG